jgi:pimeloyl-ACP methyl ester carboxylesterase
MERAIQSSAEVLSRGGPEEDKPGLFSTESVLKLQKLIFAGSPLSEILANIAQLVESQAKGMSCTIWLPDEDGKELYCAAATTDVERDRADKEASRRIECPMLHLWAEGGPLDTFDGKDGGPLGIWRQWAPHVPGRAMKGGHFFPEENPDDTADLVKQLLST